LPSHPYKATRPLRVSPPVGSPFGSRSWLWRIGVPLAGACAGLLAMTSMHNARGTDLRAGRSSDLIGIVSQQRDRVEALSRQSAVLQDQVDALTTEVNGTQIDDVQRQLDRLSVPAGLRGLAGPGLAITLDDAEPDDEVSDELDPNLLVVHQQDLQAVINALWAGGAEGISLQGQRIISTTGIKCVGNTVLLQGVPYAPPYRIVAVGNATAMYDALLASPEVQNYRDYIGPPYNLGWSLRNERRLSVPGYTAPVAFEFATPVESPPSPGG
jgi:uncharacterized protein YlxW (UPF0749 family)